MNTRKAKHFSIFCASLGSIVEWYDFMLFAYMTPIFSKLFFPNQHETTSLLATFGVYAAGFLMAPLGSLFFGSLGDRFGRKNALVFAICLMSAPMLLTAILPTYHQVGLIAPVLLTLLRLLQGFSIGGQYGGTMAFMIENAKPGRRGFIASIATMTSGSGVFLASLIIAIVASTVSHTAMLTWGFRIPYIIGALFSLTTLLMRLKMSETEIFESLAAEQQLSDKPMRETFKAQRKPLILSTCLSSYANITYYVIASYLAVYLESVLHYTHTLALTLITLFGIAFAFTAPLFGWLSDCFGRKTLLWLASLLFICTAYPAFQCFTLATPLSIGLGFVLLGLPLMLLWGAYGAASPELFSARYRYCGTGISYNIGNSFFGGLSPFFATFLISLTGSVLAPMWLLIIPAILMIPIIAWMPETSRLAAL